MKFRKLDHTPHTVYTGSYMKHYYSCNEEGYTILSTNLKLGDGDNKFKLSVDKPMVRASWDDDSLYEGSDLQDAKRACRAHFKSMTDQDKIDYRIKSRNDRIDILNERIPEWQECLNMTPATTNIHGDPLSEEYMASRVKDDAELMQYMVDELAELMQERKNDADDITEA